MLTALDPFDGDTILPLADARAQLNLTTDDSYHDAAVRAARDAAIDWAEGYTGFSLQERQFYWAIDRLGTTIRLPRSPVTSVDGASYFDLDGTDTALEEAEWYLGNDALIAVSGATWPLSNGSGLRITFSAGFALPADIPPYIMAAIRLAMTAMFEDRSNPDLSGAIRCADMNRLVIL